MKRIIALVVSALLLVIPMLSALADFGWEGDLFVLHDVGFTLAVPEGAVLASDEELAAKNADLAPFEPTTIFMVTDPATGATYAIGTYDLSDPGEIGEFALALANSLAEALGVDPSTVHVLDESHGSSFFDNASINYYDFSDTGVITFIVFVIASASGGAYAFVTISSEGGGIALSNQVHAPMRDE